MIYHVYRNMCNCIDLNNHQSLNTRIEFFNEAKIYIKITPAQQESGVCTCVAFVFKDSLLSSVFAEKGFSEVTDWLRVQES